ncbi:tryptase-2-like isoform X2 [Vombatus ursinus]|uniref:Peptidase S1 domain-containing protein n=1 Tax=Vombatus ursinus TaxID=29139 RepID=A0A4X2L080_VOMUR|nr:tryptase-2-like isoform X2 [Vombatus ursinus]
MSSFSLWTPRSSAGLPSPSSCKKEMFCLLLLTLPLLGNSAPIVQDGNEVKIVGGNDAQVGEWPWQISLRKNFDDFWIHYCGASLIHPIWVLTAAHCFTGTKNYTSNYMIQLRQQNLYEDDHLLPLEKVIIHPNYTAAHEGFDIALLKLQSPVQFTRTIQTITVPEVSQIFTPDMECWVTGWGDIESGVPLPPPYTLRKVQVSVMDAITCDQEYHQNSTIPESERIILDNMICAGEPGKDSCQGDSGGPLVCKVEGSWLQAGIVSWGIGCGVQHRPGVYTGVTGFVNWINQHIQ